MTVTIDSILDAKLAKILAEALHDTRPNELYGRLKSIVEEYGLDLENEQVQRAMRATWATCGDLNKMRAAQLEQLQSALRMSAKRQKAAFRKLLDEVAKEDGVLVTLFNKNIEEYGVDPANEQAVTASAAMLELLDSVIELDSHFLEILHAVAVNAPRKPEKNT